MQDYEYKVVPAPRKGAKARGVRTTEDRFAHALTLLMNREAAEGWEYLRADALPTEERTGFFGHAEVSVNLLVFRRRIAPAEDYAPEFRVAERAEPALTVAPRVPSTADVDRVRRAAGLPAGRQPEGGAAPRLGPARED